MVMGSASLETIRLAESRGRGGAEPPLPEDAIAVIATKRPNGVGDLTERGHYATLAVYVSNMGIGSSSNKLTDLRLCQIDSKTTNE